ncbi:MULTISPECIES: hypothetical protein [unclassified Bradyrhizobium]|uniref:hypothetical protein n=1 Tax=unclassified Bradyrhizobium TaxID=2631580 RepID=UPI0028EC9F37|nr:MULTISPECIES: hypothetical protein [unclassified Bradyrhizobium]
MPTHDELRKLIEVVYRARPDLDLRADSYFKHLDHNREFRLTFIMLGALGRINRLADAKTGTADDTETVDERRALSFWADYVRNLIYDGGDHAEVPNHILLAAALAHGDINYSRNSLALGLTWVESGRRAIAEWRGVLRTGKLRKAAKERETSYRAASVTIDLNVARDYVGFVGSVVR